jgi:hypothetical protein
LLCHGFRIDQLGPGGLSWRDFKVIVTQQPATSAIARALGGKDPVVERLEALTLFYVQVNSDEQPKAYEDLFAKESKPKQTFERDDMAKLLGWT